MKWLKDVINRLFGSKRGGLYDGAMIQRQLMEERVRAVARKERRDRIALVALQALVARKEFPELMGDVSDVELAETMKRLHEGVARAAYSYADAMLEASKMPDSGEKFSIQGGKV